MGQVDDPPKLKLPPAQGYTQLLSYVAVYQVYVLCDPVFLTQLQLVNLCRTQFGTFPKLTVTGPRPAVRQYSKPKANRGTHRHQHWDLYTKGILPPSDTSLLGVIKTHGTYPGATQHLVSTKDTRSHQNSL